MEGKYELQDQFDSLNIRKDQFEESLGMILRANVNFKRFYRGFI
jgi:hypothetical protein